MWSSKSLEWSTNREEGGAKVFDISFPKKKYIYIYPAGMTLTQYSYIHRTDKGGFGHFLRKKQNLSQNVEQL